MMGLNFGQTFTNQTQVVIPAATHGIPHAFLRVQVWSSATPRQRVRPGGLTVNPSTGTVTLDFLQAQSGLVVINGAAPVPGPQGNKRFAFSLPAGGSLIIPGTQHGFGTDHLLIDVYDGSTPAIWLPEATVTIHPTTFDVTLSTVQAQSGSVVVCAAADTGTANVGVPVTVGAGGTQTVLGTSHGLGTANLGPQLYEATGREVLPGRLTVHPSTSDVTLQLLQAFTGTLVLGGSQAVVSGPRMIIARGGALLMGGASQGQNTTGLELTTGYYTFSFVDDAQQAVDAAFIESLLCTLYDAATGQVVNSRFHQNVFNANQGTLTTTAGPPMATTFELELLPVDTAMLDQAHSSEQRVLLFQWTWAGGQRAGAHTVSFVVNNLTFVP